MANGRKARSRVGRPTKLEEQLREELALVESGRLSAGPDYPEVANRTALARFRSVTWRGFCERVNGLPQRVRDHGLDKAHTIATSELLGDLYSMSVSAPATTDEIRALDDLRLMVSHRALFRQLASPGAAYDRVRQKFIAEVARVVLRPSVPIIFKRSAQDYFGEAPVPRYGIVDEDRA